MNDIIIEARQLTMKYGDNLIQSGLDFGIRQGDIFVIMGGSGCGKKHLAETYDWSLPAR